MDYYVVVGPHTKVRELTKDMGHTMFLRDVQILERGKPPVNFLGWMLERTVNGFRLMINPQLIEDIMQDSGLANSTRKCATASVKGRVIEHKWDVCNTQWTRLGTNCFRTHCLETPHSIVGDTRDETGTFP